MNTKEEEKINARAESLYFGVRLQYERYERLHARVLIDPLQVSLLIKTRSTLAAAAAASTSRRAGDYSIPT